EPAAEHFATNDNLSVDQISLFLATRLSDHIGMFAQGTYSVKTAILAGITWIFALQRQRRYSKQMRLSASRSTTARPCRTCGTPLPHGASRTSPHRSCPPPTWVQ